MAEQEKQCGLLIPAILLLLVTLALRAIWWGDPVAGADEQLFSFIGWRMTFGELPYVDHWDRKPFGLFALFGMAHILLRSGPEAYQLLAAVSAFVCGLLTFGIARDLCPRFTAFAIAIFVEILLAIYGAHSGQAEVVYLPFMLGMVWLLREIQTPGFERRTLWAMVLGGIALQIKYTVLPQCIILGMYALLWQHRNGVEIVSIVRRAVVFAALGILPTFCVGTFYFLSGSWESWWFANFESFFLRNAGGRFNPFVLAYAIPLIAVTVSGWYAAVRIVRPDSQDTYRLVIVWTSGSFLSVLLPGTTYLYYLAAACPAAVLSAVPLFDERGPAGKWSLIFSIIIAVIFLNPYERWIQSRANTVNAEQLAEAVSDHVGPGRGCLLVFDGPTSLYRMTDSCTLSRFVYPDHLNNALEKDALGVDQLSLVKDLLSSQPPVIVTGDLALTRQNPFAKDAVNREVSAHYQYLHSEEIGGRRITAWTLGEPAMSD